MSRVLIIAVFLLCFVLVGCDLRKRESLPEAGNNPSSSPSSYSIADTDSDGDGIVDRDELTERKKYIANVPSFDVRIGRYVEYNVTNTDTKLNWQHVVDIDLMRSRIEDGPQIENRSILTQLARLSYRELVEDRIVLTSINHPYFSQFVSFQYPSPDMGVPELVRLIEDSVGASDDYEVTLDLNLNLLVQGDVFPGGKVEWLDISLYWGESTDPITQRRLKTDISLNEEFSLKLDQIEVSWSDFLEHTVLQGKIPRIVIKDFKLSKSPKSYLKIIQSVSDKSVEVIYVDKEKIDRKWVSLKKGASFQETLGFATQKDSVFENGRLTSLGSLKADFSIISNVLNLTPQSSVPKGAKFIIAQIEKEHVSNSRELIGKYVFDSSEEPLFGINEERVFKSIKVDSKVVIGLNLKEFNEFSLKNFWSTSRRLTNGSRVFTCNYSVRDFVVNRKKVWEKSDIDSLLGHMFIRFKTQAKSLKKLVELNAVKTSFFEGLLQIEINWQDIDTSEFGSPSSFDLVLRHKKRASSVGIYSHRPHIGQNAGSFCKDWFKRAVSNRSDICVKSDYSGVVPGCWDACLKNNCQSLEPIKKEVGMNPVGKLEVRVYGR